MRKTFIITGILFLAVAAMGCRTVTADPKNWTVEKARKIIEEHEQWKFRTSGVTGNVQEKDLVCSDDHFVDYFLANSTRRGDTLTRTYTTREISFVDISHVRLTWHPANPLFLVTGGIVGPWLYTLDVVMKNGETHSVSDAENYEWAFLPLWLYPYTLIHATTQLGEAIDYMRQRSTN